jgi:hypothetical protein
MLLDPNNPANHPVLDTLRSAAENARPLTPMSEAGDAYFEAGSHPEIVGFMWERLSKKFPDASRCLVYGTPCVIQPVSGVILAVGMGTQYCLRILPESIEPAAAAGCTPTHSWGKGDATDLRDVFGPNWVFGSFGEESIEWFRAAYHHFAQSPSSDAGVITPRTPARKRDAMRSMSLLVGQEPDFDLRVHTVDPDAAQVASVMRSVDWSRFATVMMWKAEQEFLEISGSLRAEDGLSATYMEGDTEKLSRTAPSLDEAISLLQSYAAGDSRYKTLVEWE